MYKLSYTEDDMQKIFYRYVIDAYNARRVYTKETYIKSVNKLLLENPNSHRAAFIMNTMFNDESELRDVTTEDIFNIKNSRKELFASLYYIPPKTFKDWLKAPHTDMNIMLSIKYFLLYGQTSFNIKIYQINEYLKSNKNQLAFKYYKDLFLLDGDNLYSHIVPLFNLKNIGNFLVFYKRSNVSPFFAAQFAQRTPKVPKDPKDQKDQKDSMEVIENIDVIQTEQSKKDAADMSICRYITMMTSDTTLVKNVQRIHIISGDESSQEIIRMTNNYVGFDYVDRINSQLVGLTRSPWDLTNFIREFPRKIYGDLIFKSDMSNLPTRSDINYFNFREYLSGPPSNTNSNNVIVSPWIIILIKKFGIGTINLQVENVIKQSNINSVDSFLGYLDNNIKAPNDIREYKDEFLKIVGTKFFTIRELLDKFLQKHVELLGQIRNVLRYLGIRTVNIEQVAELVGTDTNHKILLELVLQFVKEYPENTDFLRTYYKFINPVELYINYIDFNIALGIEDIQIDVYDKYQFTGTYDENLLENIRYFPERIIVKSITFKL